MIHDILLMHEGKWIGLDMGGTLVFLMCSLPKGISAKGIWQGIVISLTIYSVIKWNASLWTLAKKKYSCVYFLCWTVFCLFSMCIANRTTYEMVYSGCYTRIYFLFYNFFSRFHWNFSMWFYLYDILSSSYPKSSFSEARIRVITWRASSTSCEGPRNRMTCSLACYGELPSG